MVDAIVSPVLEQLISTAVDEAKQQVRLVTGVGKEVEKLKRNFRAIQAVLVDAERRQVKEESVRLWLDQLKDASYDMEDVLDEWNTARLKLQIEGVDENALVPQQKVCSSFLPAATCFCCGFKQIFLRRDIAKKIKELNETLDDIASQKNMLNLNVVISNEEKSERMQSTALINVSEVCGRDVEKNILKSKVLCESSKQQNAIQIISLVGMGGIGKTTLAQFVYNDEDVINNFDKRIWVCVSDPFDEFRIAKAIIETLQGSAPNLGELNSLLLCIDEFITGEKIFLVLDDVWTEDYNKWESFQRCLINVQRESKILVTTRKDSVAKMMGSTDVISIKQLSEQDCWSLFEPLAFFGRSDSEYEQLEEIGRKIIGKCKGLPLAAKTIGSLLRFKRSSAEWQSILDSEMWQVEEFERGLVAPLLLSYNDLPPAVKHCFSYCAIFPKDYIIRKDELIKLWLAQGYIKPKENKELEMIGEEYFDYLSARSFFQEFERDDKGLVCCKMHDIVHDFSRYLRKEECFSIEVYGDEGMYDDEEPLSLTDASKRLSLTDTTSKEKLRHTTWIGFFLDSILNAKKLRSLLIYSPYESFSPVLPGLFDQLTCLRTLLITGFDDDGDWDRGEVREIPKGIEKLIHLRFLRLASLRIEELPESCGELFNLQTLEIEECYRLERFPKGFGKLVNLRRLNRFIVSNRRSRGCKLEGLRRLNHLGGCLDIEGLGNLKDVDEAKVAEIEKKKNLVHLKFRFDRGLRGGDDEGNEDYVENVGEHEAIVEGLRPPPNLESLCIRRFGGKTLSPSWIVSLNKLKKLRLESSNECEIMPPLGKLPSLERLYIEGLNGVKRVGDEFLGIESRSRDHHNQNIHATSSSSSIIAFPKLKVLRFWVLCEWEEWDLGKEDNITIMPQLKDLKIISCSKLKSLPGKLLRSTTLETLVIRSCRVLEERYGRDKGEDWPNISHIPTVIIDPSPLF